MDGCMTWQWIRQTCDLIICAFNWWKRILSVWFVLRWPCVVDRMLIFKNDLTTNHSLCGQCHIHSHDWCGWLPRLCPQGKVFEAGFVAVPMGSWKSIDQWPGIHTCMKVTVGSVSMKLIILSVLNKGGCMRPMAVSVLYILPVLVLFHPHCHHHQHCNRSLQGE